MSAYTTEMLTTLQEAIATGALTVKYGDKLVTYRSLAEMIAIEDKMKKELGLIKNNQGRRLAQFSKGLNPKSTDC